MTPSQTESPSAPEAIENQRSRGGPWGTVSLLWGTTSEPTDGFNRLPLVLA
jgi:hypothetical protein